MLHRIAKQFDLTDLRALHIGAHRCQEAPEYHKLKFRSVLWLEANPACVVHIEKALEPYENQKYMRALVLDPENSGKKVTFNVSGGGKRNEGQSSSVLLMHKHRKFFPNIDMVSQLDLRATTVDELVDGQIFDWITIDVQGAELLALQGAEDTLQDVQYVLAEVNVQELYHGCVLLPDLDAFMAKQSFIRTITRLKRKNDCAWGNAFYEKMKIG